MPTTYDYKNWFIKWCKTEQNIDMLVFQIGKMNTIYSNYTIKNKFAGMNTCQNTFDFVFFKLTKSS